MGIRIACAAALAVAITLAGCGGASSEQAESGSGGAGIEGQVVKGPVAGASVCAYELSVSGKGPLLGCTVASQDGSYVLSIPFQGEVILEATGGSYVDEATGVATVLQTALSSVVVTREVGTVTAAITPLTHFAYVQAMQGPLSVASFGVASETVRAAFAMPAVDLVGQLPVVGSDGQGNEHGRALWTVSRAVSRGATLEGLAQKISTSGTKDGLSIADRCAQSGSALLFDVEQPLQAWRSDLAIGKKPPSCTVIEDTAERVRLSCASDTVYSSLTVLAAGSGSEYVPPSGPGDVIVAGARVRADIALFRVVENAVARFSAVEGTLFIGAAPPSPPASIHINPGPAGSLYVGDCSLSAYGAIKGSVQLQLVTATTLPPINSGAPGSVILIGGVTALEPFSPTTADTVNLAPSGSLEFKSPGTLTTASGQISISPSLSLTTAP